MARRLAAEPTPAPAHQIQHVAIAHLRSEQLDSPILQCNFQSPVRHHRSHDRLDVAPVREAGVGNHEQKLVTVHEGAFSVHHQHAIAISVERDAQISAAFPNRFAQRGRCQRSEAVIDVQSVRRASDRDHLRAELGKDVRRDLIGCTVRTVDHDPETSERQFGRHRALAEFDVSSYCIVDSRRPADVDAGDRLHRRLDCGLDRKLHLVGQLSAVGVEELDAVIRVGVVGRADDDSRRRAQCPSEVRDCRGWHRPEQHYIRSGGGETRFQHGLEHVAGNPRVLADDDLVPPA